MVPSVHYFYVKTKMLVDFKICISVPLMNSVELIKQSEVRYVSRSPVSNVASRSKMFYRIQL